MDVVWLSRLQFAAAAYFHFLFVPLTLGLSILVAIMETRWARSGDRDYFRLARFYGRLFVINFAVGIVTGLTLEFQFGTNWSRYSAYVGDIFGSLLAVEATVAFFLESTFIGLWIWGWKRLSPKAHAACMWVVAAASNVSALWILIANAWMQHPVGYALKGGRAELTDFWAVVLQPFAWHTYLHTLSGAFVLAGFFVLGISAWQIKRGAEPALFKKAFRLAAVWTMVFTLTAVVHGHYQGAEVARTQPTKLAAMEAHWETQKNAPIYALVVPGEEGKNALELLPLPSALSLLAFHSPSAEVKGLNAFPKGDRPPVTVTFISFRTMVALGIILLGLAVLAFRFRDRLDDKPWLVKLLPWAIPLPYLTNELGWTLTEVGRQPWIVYGVMKTQAAASTLAGHQVLTSLVAFIVVYGILAGVAAYLMVQTVRRGPEPAAAS